MHKTARSNIVNFSDIEARHGGVQKGNGFAIHTNTGIMSLAHRQRAGFGVQYKPATIIGKLILGPLAAGDVQLGKGERLLKITSGPLQDSIFYKFKEMSDSAKKAALLEINGK